MEDHILPPPPYSETDPSIVLSGGPARPALLTPSTSQGDAASRAPASTTSSSIDEPIYTPPYSPASSFHQNAVDSAGSVSASSSSAATYFAIRPPHTFSISPPEVIKLSLSGTTQPRDIPYPDSLRMKDVNIQDWNTFVNYLLPDHVATSNASVAERKLQAEMVDERMANLRVQDREDARSQVDAQLSPLRESASQNSGIGAREAEIEATVFEWNEGFFKPRGVEVKIVERERSRDMPGSWIPWENETSQVQNGEASSSRERPVPETRRSWLRANSDGLRMGALQADHNGFRLGNMLVAE